jgi:hypothetical protein
MTKLQLQIDDHPWGLVAFGALAGVWLASHGKRKGQPSGVLGVVVGGLALRLLREGALHGMSKLVHTFIAEAKPAAPPPPSPYAS